MNHIFLYFLVLVSTVSGHMAVKPLTDGDILAIAIQSKEFGEFYKNEAKNGREVTIYDAVGGFENSAGILIKDGGLVTIQKVNFKAEVGNSHIIVDPKIVLHRFVKTKDKYTFYFFYTEVNATLNLTYNKRGKLIDYGRGVF